MPTLAPAPRLRPTAAPGITAATMAALLERQRDGFERFEAAAAPLLGTRHAVVVGSARAGLGAMLRHAGCRPGDEVIVPSYTAPCVPGFLRASGYAVRIATVCPRRLVVTGDTVAAALSARTRAVIPTHVEGVTAPMAEIVAAVPGGVAVIEDAAHALGAAVDGRPVGAHAVGAIHSFGKGKHVNTMFGGLVVTDYGAVAAAARAARDALPPPSRLRLLLGAAIELGVAAATHPRLYPLLLHPLIRVCARAGLDLPTRLFEDGGDGIPRTATQRPPAAWGGLALAQLAGFPAERERRRRHAAALRAALTARHLEHQEANDPGDHPLFVTLLHPRRDALRAALLAAGQDTQPTWMRPIAGDDGASDPIAERAARHGLYLPLHRGADVDVQLAALDRALAQR
ncbi:MAG: DegT/DnrJ/EryC1/StrS family aminotransferase [Deltaproteobacteria bacterium]|nr:DegT/DnrJ/EryC1/StrS family aminotransferase [Deltaproteobacteria bacterium]